ncbi:hypothetical protein H4J02_06655 [Protaetiibacter sp. SSC-01]|uniref:hypothetical protein n=1 Tax=Protaetiibacter sp. SSC-01 TaxID=2759943 RepID=UPI0016574705|nr:hypothetical protein [Protaetiibacter sp. SSC-01]QNO38665.1 hypothetical protein H4J02_06655 [Protaetiibacter sp. SSC-01]
MHTDLELELLDAMPATFTPDTWHPAVALMELQAAFSAHWTEEPADKLPAPTEAGAYGISFAQYAAWLALLLMADGAPTRDAYDAVHANAHNLVRVFREGKSPVVLVETVREFM